MFEMNRRGSANRSDDESGVDEEFDKDRFTTAGSAGAKPASSTPPSATTSGARVREAAIIGPSIHIDGDLRGEEDLLVEGTVTGTVQMREHTLTIGGNGKVRADVFANSVFVDGSLEGDVYGSDRVAIRKNGTVKGNIVSPRVSLDDGGRFKGTVEMDQQAVDAAFGKSGGRGGDGGGQRPAADSGSAAAKSADAKTTPAAGSGGAGPSAGKSTGTATGGKS